MLVVRKPPHEASFFTEKCLLKSFFHELCISLHPA
jgi:hypothetical protein